MAKYTVRYEHDEDGWWVASVKGVKGCHTQGKSIEQARTRTREALSLFVEDAATAELVDDVVVPVETRRAIIELRRIRRIAEAEQAKAASMTRKIAKKLTAHMSVRDAGVVLGVSGARVQQLLEAQEG